MLITVYIYIKIPYGNTNLLIEIFSYFRKFIDKNVIGTKGIIGKTIYIYTRTPAC